MRLRGADAWLAVRKARDTEDRKYRPPRATVALLKKVAAPRPPKKD
jgi:hypothetical protein